MDHPLFSLIIPCYNQAQYLPEALDSVLAQTYPHWECIIVNDGSPDNTEEVTKAYIEKDKRFQYIYKENGGLSSARNFGIRNCSGEYILPLDADDVISKFYLEKANQHFIESPITKLVYCKAKLFGNNNGSWNLPEYNYDLLLFENMIFCSAIYRKSDYDKTNGYNEEMTQGLEDWDFWLSLLESSDIVYQIPEVCFFYRIKMQSMLNTITNEAIRLLSIQIYSNHKAKYIKHEPEIIWLTFLTKQQNESIQYRNNELVRIRSSNAYKISRRILRPIKFLTNLVTDKHANTNDI